MSQKKNENEKKATRNLKLAQLSDQGKFQVDGFFGCWGLKPLAATGGSNPNQSLAWKSLHEGFGDFRSYQILLEEKNICS